VRGSKSKKPSAASSSSKPLELLVFFLDRSLGKHKVAAALRQAGAHVEIHDDHFAPDERDRDWLLEVGARRWVVLTKDRRIRYRGPELAALLAARVAAFVLTAGNLTGEEMAAVFVKALPAMCRFAIRHEPPFVARVTRIGTVAMLLPGTRT
jgi:hypothetical protein